MSYEIGNPANMYVEGPNMVIQGPNMVVEKQHHYHKQILLCWMLLIISLVAKVKVMICDLSYVDC